MKKNITKPAKPLKREPQISPGIDLNQQCAKFLLHKLPNITCAIKQRYCGTETSDLTLQQLRILNLLKENQCSLTSELAKTLGVSLPAISRTTHKMVEEGWLEKALSKEDKRQIGLKITRKGVTALEKTQGDSYSKILPLMESLNTKQKTALFEGFQILDAILNEMEFQNENNL